MADDHSKSRLFQPLTIANGKIELKHRVIYAPMTRNRGLPLSNPASDQSPIRAWYPDKLMAEYYGQRANEGGLLISEGIPPSQQGTGYPGAPGLFDPKQISGWRMVTDAVHAKRGYIYAQLWHCGRVTLPHHTGMSTVSASADPWPANDPHPYPLPGTNDFAMYKDFPPEKLDEEGISKTIDEMRIAARNAMTAGFDGIEIHGANGYLPEQFLSSNINTRDDEYGGTPERRPKFVLDLLAALAKEIGSSNIGIRLSPFGLCHQTRSTHRIETWSSLCHGIKEREDIGPLSYIHFIEPRWEQLHSLEDKNAFLEASGLGDITLAPFRKIMGDTPLVSAGGWNSENCWAVVESGEVDALAFGRLFLANPDFVERLQKGRRMNAYDRSRFYGPTPEREAGYTDYPSWKEAQGRVDNKWFGEAVDNTPDFLEEL